jgi:hypothetical protein
MTSLTRSFGLLPLSAAVVHAELPRPYGVCRSSDDARTIGVATGEPPWFAAERPGSRTTAEGNGCTDELMGRGERDRQQSNRIAP